MSNLQVQVNCPTWENSPRYTYLQRLSVISNSSDFLHFLLIWITLTSVTPFALYLAIPHHPYKTTVFLGLAIACLVLIMRGKLFFHNPVLAGILITQSIFFIFPFSLLHSEFHTGYYISLSLQYVSILILYAYVSTIYSVHKMAKSFVYVVCLMAILGSVCFFLGLIGAIYPVSTYKNIDGTTGYNFLLTFTKAIFPITGKSFIIRVAAFFDEPGTFAYFITMAMLINKIYEISRKVELILIVGGIFTLSIAFYIVLATYLIVFYFSFRRRTLKYFLFLGVLLIATSFYVSISRNDSKINSMLYSLSIGRFERTSDERIIAGDNRSGLFNVAARAFADSPLIGQGMGSQLDPANKYYRIFLDANLFSPLAKHGLLGTLIAFLSFFYWTYICFATTKDRNLLISCWLIVMLTFLQRPEVIGFLNNFVILFLVESTVYRLKG